jgi:hypothetical protein
LYYSYSRYEEKKMKNCMEEKKMDKKDDEVG